MVDFPIGFGIEKYLFLVGAAIRNAIPNIDLRPLRFLCCSAIHSNAHVTETLATRHSTPLVTETCSSLQPAKKTTGCHCSPDAKTAWVIPLSVVRTNGVLVFR